MCGIAGVLSLHPEPGLDEIARQMGGALAHRGPDGDGTWLSPGGRVALAHRRLAIIDLSSGAQPMHGGGLTLVYNGEIYNFPALRAQAVARGYPFRSHSDSECILAEWVASGEQCLARLRGMFAFALWDDSSGRLTLARDRFGKKPLFYCWHGARLLFASEIKALLGVIPRPVVDPVALTQYLMLGYVPGARTIYRGVSRVPPGHLLRIERDGTSLLRQYWELPTLEPGPARGAAAWEEDVARQIDEAVRLRMISDVPLGAFLSGGLDSSTIVAHCVRHARAPFHTFSIRAAGAGGSPDADAARVVSAYLGTVHHEEQLDCPGPDELVELLLHFDEPFADSSLIPTAAVSRAARRVVTVSLSGDGADELFGGYNVYLHLRWLARADRLPLARPLARLAAHLWHGRGATTLARLALPEGERLLDAVRHFRDPLLARMVGSLGQAHTEALAEVGALFRYPEDAARGGAVGRAEWIDAARGYLAGDILPKVDLAAMKFGLEVRAPFLDHVLAESVMALPERLRVHRGRGKWLLRRIGRRFLPAEIIERRKVGFSIPLQEWLNGPWRPLVEEYLGPAAPLRRLIDLDACVEAGGRPGDEDSAQRQFTLLAAAVWAAESARA